MEQTKALNALEPFLALTKSVTTPRQAADLVVRATSAPNTYLFTELLQLPQIQSLSSSPEYSSHLALLSIFSHGVYTTYLSTPDLPALTPQQTLKLRQLSLLTLAKDRCLSYTSLTTNLGLSNPRELEDLVTTSIYAGLVDATLDPAHETVHIHSVAPLRDVDPRGIPDLLSSLRSWAGRCEAALADLEGRVRTVRAAADVRARGRAEWEGRVAKLVEDEAKAVGQQGQFELPGHGAGHGHGHGHGRVLQGQQHMGFGSGGGLPARGPGGGGGGAGAGGSQQGSLRGFRSIMKRGSGHMDEPQDVVDDEAMDLDEEDELGEKKRSSRRKLLG